MFTYEDLTIRTVEETDLEKMRALRNDPSTWMMLEHVGFIEPEEQRQWFEKVRAAADRRYYILCDKEHAFVGIVRTDQIDRINRSIRIGVDIVSELRGKGFGSKAFVLLKKFCFDEMNIHRIWLAVIETNTIALNLYKKQGFKEEGRFRSAIFRDGKYHDYIIMSILEEEYRKKS